MILAFAIHAVLWLTNKVVETGTSILKISQPVPIPGMYGHLKWSKGAG
jgi:hypothetical protein